MCGILGFNWPDRALGERLCQLVKHRGPDQEGVFSEQGITLGFRRLSIIDLSEQGSQPMPNEDGTVQLVFNGEIYNFLELRKELEAKGHRFRSKADSEVIVHAYEEWAEGCLDPLQGMFALGLWDQKKQKLLLARDRLGIKPLYYYFRQGRLAFASEIKSLLQIPEINGGVDLQALYYYLGYEFVSSPLTMFEGIQKLRPGHYLQLSGNELIQESYWDLNRPGTSLTQEEAVIELRRLLQETVKSHLVSDVPLGVFLSGGLDSSTLVALMRGLGVNPLKTFSIGYPDPSSAKRLEARSIPRAPQGDPGLRRAIRADDAVRDGGDVGRNRKPPRDRAFPAVRAAPNVALYMPSGSLSLKTLSSSTAVCRYAPACRTGHSSVVSTCSSARRTTSFVPSGQLGQREPIKLGDRDHAERIEADIAPALRRAHFDPDQALRHPRDFIPQHDLHRLRTGSFGVPDGSPMQAGVARYADAQRVVGGRAQAGRLDPHRRNHIGGIDLENDPGHGGGASPDGDWVRNRPRFAAPPPHPPKRPCGSRRAARLGSNTHRPLPRMWFSPCGPSGSEPLGMGRKYARSPSASVPCRSRFSGRPIPCVGLIRPEVEHIALAIAGTLAIPVHVEAVGVRGGPGLQRSQ